MSTNLTKEEKLKIADISAAHQLMTDFVRENASDVARTISDLVPFLCGECNMSELKSSLNIVNITFATVALDVIRVRNEQGNGNGMTLCLPVDAMEMQNALYDLSRFMKMFEPLASYIERNEDMPAFRMSMSCFDKVDSI